MNPVGITHKNDNEVTSGSTVWTPTLMKSIKWTSNWFKLNSNEVLEFANSPVEHPFDIWKPLNFRVWKSLDLQESLVLSKSNQIRCISI